MPSLLLVMFVLQLAIEIISGVGAQHVSELAWTLFNMLPTPSSSAVSKAAAQKKQLLKLKRELRDVSPQDDFARWAKLDRQHNKLEAEYQKTNSSVSSAKSRFTSIVGTLRWLGTTGIKFVLQSWFQREPMFWIPSGWFPYYIEWLLSFPRAPVGSVSIQVWGMACAAVITLGAELMGAVFALATGQTTSTGKMGAEATKSEKRQPQAMGAGAGGAKKEL